MEKRTNCKNCGAPLDAHGNCSHCGTVARKKPKSEIIITADCIRFICTEEDDEDESM